ncbi:MAG: glutamate racemase [Actinobacteria bacterium]|nr:glutamate racemase [Actinomycetota bacterium]
MWSIGRCELTDFNVDYGVALAEMNAQVDRPIGMFDSGFGGLTVARALIDMMPSENLVYIGDTGRYPYGNKSASDVRNFALEIANSLVHDFNVKMIVVACNTAASVALHELQNSLSVPVIGVVEPGARALVHATKNNRVAVIGTVGTIASGAYENAVANASSEITGKVSLTATACPGFVEFVEHDETSGKAVTELAEMLLAPIRNADVDALLLGCTHYPYLSAVISQVMGSNVKLINSADATASVVRDALETNKITRSIEQDSPDSPRFFGSHEFYSSGDIRHFAELGRRFLGPELSVAKQWPK